jgi:hypothetical protein
MSSVGTKIVFMEIVASYGFSPQADHHILSHRVKAGRGDQITDITRNCCDLAIDPHLCGHVLPNFRKQLARAVRLRHIVITSRRPRCLFFSIQRVGSDGDDRIASQHLRPSNLPSLNRRRLDHHGHHRHHQGHNLGKKKSEMSTPIGIPSRRKIGFKLTTQLLGGRSGCDRGIAAGVPTLPVQRNHDRSRPRGTHRWTLHALFFE